MAFMDAALLLLVGYAAAIAAASLFGGWLPSAVRMTHTRTQMAMSLVAGLILGVALYHLLPNALARLDGSGAMEVVVWWTMLGMVFMVLLLRVLPFHQHDFSNGAPASGGNHSLSWLGIVLGMGLHSLIEGMALGASIQAERAHEDGAGLIAGGVFLAILLHKPLDALSITSVMGAAQLDRRLRATVNLCFALLCPAAAFLTFWGAELLGPGQEATIGRTLAFSAGVFLCISLSDLLPEIRFHTHDRGKLTLAFLVGTGLAYALHWMKSGALHGG